MDILGRIKIEMILKNLFLFFQHGYRYAEKIPLIF
jgi:hypothetical protein